jgi:hypothetical protein
VTQAKLAARGFVVAGALFLIAGVLPFLRGGSLNPAWLASAAVFLMIGANAERTRRAAQDSPLGTDKAEPHIDGRK